VALEDETLPKRSFAEGDIVEATGKQAEGYEEVPDAVGGGYGGYGGSGQSYMGYDRKPYTNEDGKEIVVYFYNGRPLSKIPEGYTETGVSDDGGGSVGTAITGAITKEVEQKKDRDSSTQWARDIGVMEGASNEEVFRAMSMSPDGTNLNEGYWSRDPEGWNSSDWNNYNESLNSGFKIPGTDIRINAAEALLGGISIMSGAPGYVFGAILDVGKKNMAKKANTWAKDALKNKFASTTVDQRTVLNTAYSTGLMLGEIAEGVSIEEWAKKTYKISTLPEVDQAKVDARRGPNANIGYGWTKGLNARELADAIDTHNNYSQAHQIKLGMATIDKNGSIIGSKAGRKDDGGYQPGLFEGSNGIVMRYKPADAISSNYANNVFQDIGYEVKMDDAGNAFYMAGTNPFNQKKVIIPAGSTSTNGDAIKLPSASSSSSADAGGADKDDSIKIAEEKELPPIVGNVQVAGGGSNVSTIITPQPTVTFPVTATRDRDQSGTTGFGSTTSTSNTSNTSSSTGVGVPTGVSPGGGGGRRSVSKPKKTQTTGTFRRKDDGGFSGGFQEGGLVQKPKKK